MTIVELIQNLLSDDVSVNKRYTYINYTIDISADRKGSSSFAFKIEITNCGEKSKSDRTYYSLFKKVHIIADGLIIDNVDSCSLIVSTKDGNTEYLDAEENKDVEYLELKKFILYAATQRV